MLDLTSLNPPQREAVLHDKGPLLILAGAGSGKTRVITYRIAYLIQERNVSPYSILAITFTNKAAEEMRQRVNTLLEGDAYNVWISTFHSMCVRMLRRFADRIGYEANFTIYDTDDVKSLMKQVLKALAIDTKNIKEKYFMNAISAAKNECISAESFARSAHDYTSQTVAKVYLEYQRRLKENNAMDFDDLLCKTVELLDICGDALEYYQRRFEYILVDEYQDTNTAQFKLIKHLATHYDEFDDKYYHNLCVVGDDDQSIYKFRGADITNILNFENTFTGARVIKLEQNYRSTGNILTVANEVIHNNSGRKDKTLWTAAGEGTQVLFNQYNTDIDEAKGIAKDISDKLRERPELSYKDFAILYRTNAQSRLIEEQFIFRNIPYKIVGGHNFYSRKEIKDILAYLKILDNEADSLQLRRIINVPKRGIGDATIEHLQSFADANGMSLFDAIHHAEFIPEVSRAKTKLKAFADVITELQASAKELPTSKLIEEIIDVVDYESHLQDYDADSTEDRMENISSLADKAILYEAENDDATLSSFLQEISLVAEIDEVDSNEDRVLLMTLHGAKGLEFNIVYMCGMEDGLFPSQMSFDNPSELEEERRLCYVGITRAEKELIFTAAKQRMLHGQTQFANVSRFIVKEIPRHLISIKGHAHESYMREEKRAFTPQANASFSPLAASNPYTSGKAYNSPYKASEPVREIEPPTTSTGLGYAVGDTVSHIRFGKGTVIAIDKGSRDYEVSVDFNGTVKKMLSSFAKLKKV